MRPFHITILMMLFCIQILPAQSSESLVPAKETGVDGFWNTLQELYGKAFEGTVTHAAATDTTFKGKTLTMHVRACSKDIIRIPFFVGDDASRTWVLTRDDDRILLKHDHRHRDGSEDDLTQYGGWSTHSGADTLQIFPVDQFTVDLLPATVANVWWIELVAGTHFTYNLRRVNTDRRFSVRFDLTRPVPKPDAPWGWKD